jgi:hypothetical protein
VPEPADRPESADSLGQRPCEALSSAALHVMPGLRIKGIAHLPDGMARHCVTWSMVTS